MKKISLFILMILFSTGMQAQVTGSFVVRGNVNYYYPITFVDGGFGQNVATELTLGRSGVHQDSTWRGAIISKFRYHVTNWGNGAQFINADIFQNQGAVTITNFIGGWQDVTLNNGDTKIVIWLRGGTTTYFYNSNYAVTPVVYDGIANALPYNITNGGTLTYKTTADAYVNQNGTSLSASIFTNGTGNNYFAGNIGIGTTTPQMKLDVNGGINANTESHYSVGAFTDADPGTSHAIKVGSNGIAVSGNSVFNGGYVMIGPAAPATYPATLNTSYLLNVNGTARANKIVVNTTGADFVFEPGYKLAPLNKVEEFIKSNHHLSGIIPAGQMQKDGVDVGDNQTKLLQKIEELTLYVIEQNKRSEAQDKLIAQQQVLLQKMQQEINSLKK